MNHALASERFARHALSMRYEDLPADAILHAKTVVADGLLSVVGSSNLDLRSFEANAECNDLILDPATAARMEERYREDLTRSVEIVRPAWKRRGALHRFFDAAARRLSPLL